MYNVPMNDTNAVPDVKCERCDLAPAEILVEHSTYGEAICHWCDEDEARRHRASEETEYEWQD